MIRHWWISLAACLTFPAAAGASGLVVNGGFEFNGGAGTSVLAGWTVVSQTGSAGSWYAQTGSRSAVNNLPVLSPPAGTFAAMTDMSGPGTVVLLQSFTVPSAGVATLSFDYSIVNLGPDFIDPNTLDFTAGPNQQVRVDILSGSAGPFDMGASVLLNVLQPQSGASLISGAYVPVSLDISSAVGSGGTYQLRFAAVDTQNYLLFGVDGVRITFTPAGALNQCDVNADGVVKVGDVQELINQALGAQAPDNDLNQNGAVNVVDVQIVLNAAMNLGCSAQ